MTFSCYFSESFSTLSELCIAFAVLGEEHERALVESMLEPSVRVEFSRLAGRVECLPRELRRSLAGEVIRTRFSTAQVVAL